MMGIDEVTQVSDRQRLLDLYSAAAACKCDISLYEHHEPDAPDALVIWASTVGREAKYTPGEYPSIEVAIGTWAITVHIDVNTHRNGAEMADLTDTEIANWAGGRPANPTTSQGVYMALEIQRHRAAMKRLEEMALSLEHAVHPDKRALGAELRNRMKGS